MAAAQRLAKKMRYEKATLCAQTWYRRAAAQRSYAKTRTAVLRIQSAYRGKVGRATAEAARRERAAIVVQRFARGAAARSAVRTAHARAVVLQCRWRSKVARRKLRTLRTEAKESGKLLQDKERLEAQLKEMQARFPCLVKCTALESLAAEQWWLLARFSANFAMPTPTSACATRISDIKIQASLERIRLQSLASASVRIRQRLVGHAGRGGKDAGIARRRPGKSQSVPGARRARRGRRGRAACSSCQALR